MLTPVLGALKKNYLKYGGSHFNFPENNCCDCGIEEAPEAVLPNTSVGCSHSVANKMSKPMVEYCNVDRLSKSECGEMQLTFRGFQCQWIPC